MNRRLLAIFAAILLTASLCACKGEEETNDTTESNIIVDTETDTEDEESTTKEDESDPKTPLTFVNKKDTVYVIASTGAVNLRKDTTLTSDSIYKSVPNGTELQRIAISQDGTWSKVVYENKELYIKSNFLTTLADVDAGFVEVSKTLTIKTEGLNVRIAPYNSGETPTDKVGSLARGDVITVLMENTESGWYKITYKQGESTITGYVASDAEYFEAASEDSTEAQG